MHNSEDCKIQVGDVIIEGKTCERLSFVGTDDECQYGVDLVQGIEISSDVTQLRFYIGGKWHDAKVERSPSVPDFSRIFVSISKP